uniref:Uncharacterized protein n=1 Tax=viral metagenome TaxID=1070528 RepID=A0A6C0JL74_9ZZZZ
MANNFNPSNDGIFNNDQGYFRNITSSQITTSPSLNLAALSNSTGDKTSDVIISLNTIYLSWTDFSTLFFKSPSGAFYISPANSNVSAVSFNYQTYETTYNKNVVYNLADQVRKAWSKKNSKPESAIPAKINIELERESFLTKSLGSVYGDFLGLSYDEALASLLGSGEIAVGTSEDAATVTFLINYQFYFQPLDINLLTIFSYVTNIPCYKNVVPFSSDCTNPYSNDNKTYDRSNLDLSDNVSVFSDFESKNNDAFSLASNNSNILSQISKIIDSESVVSSQW